MPQRPRAASPAPPARWPTRHPPLPQARGAQPTWWKCPRTLWSILPPTPECCRCLRATAPAATPCRRACCARRTRAGGASRDWSSRRRCLAACVLAWCSCLRPSPVPPATRTSQPPPPPPCLTHASSPCPPFSPPAAPVLPHRPAAARAQPAHGAARGRRGCRAHAGALGAAPRAGGAPPHPVRTAGACRGRAALLPPLPRLPCLLGYSHAPLHPLPPLRRPLSQLHAHRGVRGHLLQLPVCAEHLGTHLAGARPAPGPPAPSCAFGSYSPLCALPCASLPPLIAAGVPLALKAIPSCLLTLNDCSTTWPRTP